MTATPVFTEASLIALMQAYLWPLMRVGAMVMVAPVFGVRLVPPRVRLLIAAAMAALLLPVLPDPPALAVFSGPWFLALLQELAAGIVLGFVLQIVFEAVVFGGEIVSLSMGLSFAQMTDPLRGSESTALSQYYLAIATLLFVALDGHLALIRTVAHSFETLPVASAGLAASAGGKALVAFAAQALLGGVQIALPALIGLLIVNLAFGVISRAAPTLNPIAIGLPISLLFGLALLPWVLPSLQIVLTSLLARAFMLAAQLLGA